MKRSPARARIQIYFDVIQAIQEELTNGTVKPTRIQFKSKLSYDSLLQYLQELKKLKMISNNPIVLTEKGKSFIQDFIKITSYLDNSNYNKMSRLEKQIVWMKKISPCEINT